jgi:hypothetical protein
MVSTGGGPSIILLGGAVWGCNRDWKFDFGFCAGLPAALARQTAVRPSARKTSVHKNDFRMISTFCPSYVIAVETGKISIWKASGDALASAARISSALLSIPPGQQLVDPIDLVVGDAAQDIGQPGLQIDAVKLCGLDQRLGNGHRYSSTSSIFRKLSGNRKYSQTACWMTSAGNRWRL